MITIIVLFEGENFCLEENIPLPLKKLILNFSNKTLDFKLFLRQQIVVIYLIHSPGALDF